MANPLGRSTMGVRSVGMALFTVFVMIVMLYGVSQWAPTRAITGLNKGRLPMQSAA